MFLTRSATALVLPAAVQQKSQYSSVYNRDRFRVYLVLMFLIWQEARDTSDLIDQLLWVLGPVDSRETGFVFFDLDETLVTRDTCLIDGLGSTR